MLCNKTPLKGVFRYNLLQWPSLSRNLRLSARRVRLSRPLLLIKGYGLVPTPSPPGIKDKLRESRTKH